MRSLAIALALLAASCGSSTKVIESRVLGCESGGDLMIRAGLQGQPHMTGHEGFDDRMTMLVEVSNNAHHEIVVKQVRVEQAHNDSSAYRLDPIIERVNKTIAEDDDFTFELPMTGRPVGTRYGDEKRQHEIQLLMSLYLANGDTYRCGLTVPIPY